MDSTGSERRRKAEVEAAEAKPDPVEVLPDNIPPEMKECPQWVGWRWERRTEKGGRSKWTKAPLNPASGGYAKANDPETWGALAEALALYGGGRADGIGFVFSAADPFAGVDLDDCRDAQSKSIDPWARHFIDLLNSYTELSPSGTGLKVFARGDKPGPACKRAYASGEVEMYDRGRFFCVTGHRLEGTPAAAEARPAELARVYQAVFGGKGPEAPEPTANGEGRSLTDEQLIAKAKAAKNREKFKALWGGDLSGYDGDDSRADLALCGMLAFWCRGDADRIDRLFRRSGLMRPKWDEVHFGDGRTYGEATVEKALSGKTEFYTPGQRRGRVRRGRLGESRSGQAGAGPEGAGETGEEAPTGYEIILAYFREKYLPGFRRGTVLFSGPKGREVKMGEALAGAPIELIDRLAGASDVPMRGKEADRERLPYFFHTWGRSAWVDLLGPLPDEEESGEVLDMAREEFRGRMTDALQSFQSFAYAYKDADGTERSEVQRRPLIGWCQMWAKPGNWQSVRGLRLWVRKEPAEGNRLCIALRVELFGQIKMPRPAATQNRLTRLAELYDVGTGERAAGCRVLELAPEFIALQTYHPDAGGGLTNCQGSHAPAREGGSENVNGGGKP